MKPSEFKKVITLLRDCENKIDFIVHLYDLVDQTEPLEEESGAVAKIEDDQTMAEKKSGKSIHTKESDKAAVKEEDNRKKATEKKVTGQQSDNKPKWKPKKCEVCGEIFQPKNNRQTRCEKCKRMTVEEDIKHTASELASIAQPKERQ